MAKNEVLAFDWGTTIIGILDVNENVYTPCKSVEGMIEGAKRIAASTGTIVSLNGNGKDLLDLAKEMGLSSVDEMGLECTHDDMMEIISRIRWPPDPGTSLILGSCLRDTYRYYFDHDEGMPPSCLQDEYVIGKLA